MTITIPKTDSNVHGCDAAEVSELSTGRAVKRKKI
jgi:hypothetical protein